MVSWAMEVPTREEREDPFAGDGFDARRASAIAAAVSIPFRRLDNSYSWTCLLMQNIVVCG